MSREVSHERGEPGGEGDVARERTLTGSASGDRAYAPSGRTSERLGPAGDGEGLPPGRHLGRYVLIGRVGAGGMGVVYAAYDTKLDRKVALKVLHGPDDERRQGRLLREAQALAKLAHPNVAAAYDVGGDGELLLLAMEFVEGETLRSWLASPRSVRDVLAVFVAAGRGLAAAHAAGVVHRDFKPDNVLVGKDGRPRVVDFGLARTADEGSPASAARPHAASHSAMAGTPAYMSPEQQRGERLDARSDQYSFCVALHEALYGERPGPPSGGAPRHPSPARPRPPAWVARAVARGLSAEPAGRYPNLGALLADLSRDPGAARRRALGVALVALSGLALIGAWWGRARAMPPCRDAGGQLAGAWGDARRQAVRAAFLATGKPYAEAALAEATRALDDYAGRWGALRAGICEATHVRHEQSQELFELRNGCLDERRRALAAYADELTRADAKAVQLAPLNAHALPDLARCSDVAGLQALVPPPNDEAARRRIDGVRDRLARIEALRIVGKVPDARAQIGAAVADAEAIGYAPLAAEARWQQGALDEHAKDLAAVADVATRAILHAEAGRHAELLVKAWARLALAQSRQSRFDEARSSARHAEALLEGMGRPPELDAWVSGDLGSVFLRCEEPVEAERYNLRSLELERRLYGPDDVRLSAVHNNLAGTYSRLGRRDEVMAHQRRSVELIERAYGASHPRLCMMLSNLGGHLQERGLVGEALSTAERALTVCEAAYGADSFDTVMAAMNLGNVLLTDGQLDRALALERRAVGGFERATGPESVDTAQALANLGSVLTLRNEHAAAADAAARSVSVGEKILAPDNLALGALYAGQAEVLLGAGRRREALESAGRAVAIAEAKLGASNVTTAVLRTILGAAQLAAGRGKPARATLAASLDALEAAGADASPLDVTSARLALALARGAEGAELLARARGDFDRQGNAGRQRLAQLEGWFARR